MSVSMILRLLLVALFVVVPWVFASGTHLRAGYIRAERVGAGTLTFRITLVVFTNQRSTSVPVGGDDDVTYLYFGDGQRVFVPETVPVVLPGTDPAAGIGVATFTVVHTYGAYKQYKITYQEPNRNAGVVNASGTLTSLFYLETVIDLDPQLDVIVATPEPLMPPVFEGAVKSNFTGSVASRGVDGFSHFYTLVAPLKQNNVPLTGYVVPENFEINRITGQITWDTKFKGAYIAGEYAMAVRIHQFKDERKVCDVLVDFQIILTEEDVSRPLLTDNVALDENNRVYLPEGALRAIRIFAEDGASESISLRVYSELEDNIQFADAVVLSEYDSVEGSRSIHAALLELRCLPGMVRVSPYPVSVRAAFNRGGVTVYGDISYLVFTTDAALEYPDPVLASSDDEEAGSLRAYPNPVEDFLYLEGRGIQSVRLYSMEGELILYEKPGAATCIDFRNRKPGIYFLQYERNDSNTALLKIVRKK